MSIYAKIHFVLYFYSALCSYVEHILISLHSGLMHTHASDFSLLNVLFEYGGFMFF